MTGHEEGPPSVSLATVTLLGLGVVVTLLGLVIAGSLLFTALGLASVAVAGILELAARRLSPPAQSGVDDREEQLT